LAARSVDQTASLGVGYSFEAIVRPKLAIDVVQVVPECLRRDLQFPHDSRRVASLSEQGEDACSLIDRRYLVPEKGFLTCPGGFFDR